MGSRKTVTFLSLMTILMVMAANAVVGEIAASPLGRHLTQSDNGTSAINQLDDTVRVDPLKHLKKYRGGYDIQNNNYWSSTVFTGIYGYSVAVLWLLCGIVYGGYLVVNSFRHTTVIITNHKKKISASPMQCYLCPRLLAMFLTLLAIIGTGLVLGGDANFHHRAKKVVGILIDTADDAVHTIKNTTAAMKDLSNSLAMAADTKSSATSSFLATTYESLDSEGDDIQRQARKNRRAIDKALDILGHAWVRVVETASSYSNIRYTITTITLSVNLVTVIALSAFGVLRLRKIFHLFIILCWILTALVWLFFGIYFFLSNFAGDTCTAFEGFQKNPYNNSLSSLLPCDEIRSAKSVLRDASIGVHKLVKEINRNLSSTYGNVAQICNPFTSPPQYLYQPDNCPTSSVKIGDIPQLLKIIGCPDLGGGTCTGGILIPARDYYTAETYATSIQRLLDVYPDMNSLVECQTVTIAFSEILNHQCKPLKKYARMVWASTVFLSMVMVALVLTWTAAAHHEQQQHPSDSPVTPYSTDIHVSESGAAKEISKLDILPSSVL